MGLAESNPLVQALYTPAWFAQVHKLDRAGAQRALDRQIAWKGKSAVEANASIDRGEAECHELASQNPGWVVVSQDHLAIDHGRKLKRPVFAIPDVLLVFAVRELCLAENAWKIYEEMVAADPMATSRFWSNDDETKAVFLELAANLKGE